MSQEIEHLSEKRRKWVEANRENGFESGLKRLLTDLYPDNAHFIYELLQNAEDAQANEVRFILHEDRIEFEHDGKRLFSITDVDAITSIGFSTKRDDATSIGKFGVGFKAVFAYTETPQVESGELCFNICDMVVPKPAGFSRGHSVDTRTRFILPFDSPKKSPERARNEIERLLKALGATTLLFLTHIRKIEYLLPDSTLGYIERTGLGDNRFEISAQHPHELTPSSTWFLKFDKEIQLEDNEVENENQKMKFCRIAVAFGLLPVETKSGAKEKKAEGTDASREWELASMEPGRVCIYFPADKETSNLRFHLHAPFASTVARDSVRDCAGNNQLRDHLADLLAESMPFIRDQGLLTVRALALLPNDKDNLPKFYEPLMSRLVREFQEQDLVPMKRGGHAAANGIFRSSMALSDLIDDDDMVTLLGDGFATPIWASNPPQRNQQEGNFLSMLGIEEWTNQEFVEVLSEFDVEPMADWLRTKSEDWHQRLYAFVEDQADQITDVKVIRCSDGLYRKGGECFFPTEEIEKDGQFPRVSKGVFCSGKNKDQQRKARNFLETVGVREVDERVEIEGILKSYYTYESEKPKRKDHYSHLRRFMRFLDDNPMESDLFKESYLLMVEGEEDVVWSQPSGVYLDSPYKDTGLSAYYDTVNEKSLLSKCYEKSEIEPKNLCDFANRIGVLDRVEICQTDLTDQHPDWDDLKGRFVTVKPDSYDFKLPDQFRHIHTEPTLPITRLLWITLCGSDTKCLKAYHSGKGKKDVDPRSAASTLIHDLRKAKWVPQKTGDVLVFVQPRDAIAENLPEGFEYQTGWEWLKAIEFGKGLEEHREAQRREQERQSQEYKSKEQAAKRLGFDSPEDAEEMARLKKENPEEFRRFKESAARKERPTFPTRPLANPERRQERIGKQLTDATNKKYEKRERSVRTTNGAIDPTTWLRNQYTNEADQMVCQICKEEMPFRKRDGAHYFEKKEALSRKYLPKEHEAQYLALCPLCAAKYDEFVKTDDQVMAELREKIVSAEDYEIPISLGDEKTSIRFVETHLHDLKVIMDEVE